MPTKQKSKNTKYIFVVGGVMSGVGKGVTASSIGTILQARGFTVTAMKVDPYINVDAGTMNPTEHGEVFVLEDGRETDQDMGNYERFLNTTLDGMNYMTTGHVYQEVIEKERNLEYKGKCVQVVPHIPLEVIRRIKRAAKKADADVVVVEIGGTVGEYENILFIEAIRMLKLMQPKDVTTVMVSYVPIPKKVGEMKTKPTQHAVRTLNSTGVHPDFIVARSDYALDLKRKEKIALFCNISKDHVISAPDIESIYEVPVNFENAHLSDFLLAQLSLKPKKPSDLSAWKALAKRAVQSHAEVNIAVVGKYFDTGDFMLSDAYISVLEAIKCSAYKVGVKPIIHWVSSKQFTEKVLKKDVVKFDGILVPGGFGETGIEGKIHVIEYARKNKVPYFGLCYGMQLMVVEYARHVLKLADAHTVEINPNTTNPVIDIMPEQKKLMEAGNYGGTMRLGAYPALLKNGTLARKLYGKPEIQERHRHRYEVNPEYIAQLEAHGLVFSGKSPDGVLMEIAELPVAEHPFFLGTQFHPEFTARPLFPHPLFTGFVQEVKKFKEGRKTKKR
ncbi:MAG: CTP synthetase [Parcubacteria group bacterium GW2011_GWA2_43_11]|nr:MAG: CTP synthetase [Parcubacteria group bacterium GW2011_GWA2_43_11]